MGPGTTPSEIHRNFYQYSNNTALLFNFCSEELRKKSRPLPLAVSRLSRGTALLSALHYCRDSVRLPSLRHVCLSVSHSLFPFPLVFAAVAVLIAARRRRRQRIGEEEFFGQFLPLRITPLNNNRRSRVCLGPRTSSLPAAAPITCL